MENNQQQTFVKVLACLAWADGSASGDEMKKVCDLVSSAGANLDKATIVALVDATRKITPDLLWDVEALPFDIFVGLLVFALEVAAVDKVVSVSEQTVIRQIASIHYAPEKIAKMYEWLLAKRKADRLFEEAFEHG